MKWTRSFLLIAFAVFALSFGFVFIVVSVVATQFMRLPALASVALAVGGGE